MITAFNKREKLPRYIIILLDKDILDAMAPIDKDETIDNALEKCLMYMARQCDRLIAARKEQLLKKRLGAVNFEPRIIWIKMILRPAITSDYHPDNNRHQVQQALDIFNETLDHLADKFNHYILEITELEYLQHFDNLGNLNYKGKITFWKDLDKQIKEFEKKEISLRPPRRRLPKPPDNRD